MCDEEQGQGGRGRGGDRVDGIRYDGGSILRFSFMSYYDFTVNYKYRLKLIKSKYDYNYSYRNEESKFKM